jgi:hypothetical protein
MKRTLYIKANIYKQLVNLWASVSIHGYKIKKPDVSGQYVSKLFYSKWFINGAKDLLQLPQNGGKIQNIKFQRIQLQ